MGTGSGFTRRWFWSALAAAFFTIVSMAISDIEVGGISFE
jgi:hypothetical protein